MSINKPLVLKKRDRLAGLLWKPRLKSDPAGINKLLDLPMNDILTGSRGSKTDLASINKPSDLKNCDRLAGTLQKARQKADPAEKARL